MPLQYASTHRRPWQCCGLLHFEVLAFGLRPARIGRGRSSSGPSSANKRPTGTCSTFDNASRVSTVTFSSPRSTRPTYERSMPDSRASRSCDSPCSTRSFRRFQPIVSRVPMYRREGHNHGLTIHGPMIPYSFNRGCLLDSRNCCRPQYSQRK